MNGDTYFQDEKIAKMKTKEQYKKSPIFENWGF
jgi:hypothetical protein